MKSEAGIGQVQIGSRLNYFGNITGCKKLDAAPRYADIVDGKLYVFLNAVAFAKYQEDEAGTLEKAEKNWPAMYHVAVEEVNGGV